MQTAYSILNFVPFYIFVPILLVGLLGLFRTPSSTRTFDERSSPLVRDPLSPNVKLRGTSRMSA